MSRESTSPKFAYFCDDGDGINNSAMSEREVYENELTKGTKLLVYQYVGKATLDMKVVHDDQKATAKGK